MTSGHADPFNGIDLNAEIVAPDGSRSVLPGFWAGDDLFRFRFSAPNPGRYEFRTSCSADDDQGLHDRVGWIEIASYEGSNPLYSHGRIRVAADRRRFEHIDGTPFFWLGDTHWQAFTSRLDWPFGFATLADDRVAKGFSVVQVVAGPLSGFEVDESWHKHQSNEAGWPWERGWERINPRFYDQVDLKIAGYVDRGLMPCIVGTWGYYLNLMGLERMRQHWRYLVARYAALPVVWCLADEVQMAVYSLQRAGGSRLDAAVAEQADGWTDMAGWIRSIDPYGTLITTHPAAIRDEPEARDGGSPPGGRLLPGSGRSVLRADVLDFDMLQCGHYGFQLLEPTVELVERAMEQTPRLPVVNGEVNYEGIAGSCWQDIQRFQFWSAITDGAAGYTYGAAGLWVFWSRTTFSKGGDSEYMEDAGGGPWEEVMHLPGSTQVGIGKRLLERYPWWDFERIDEPEVTALGRPSAFATGIPGTVAVYYVPSGLEPESLHGILKAGDRAYFWWRLCLPIRVGQKADYHAFWFDPRTGTETPIGAVTGDEHGFWVPPAKPSLLDWVLVLENESRLPSRAK
jgi:hypothetical protein